MSVDITVTLPIDLCYHGFFSKGVHRNLLKNVNGEHGFAHWTLEGGSEGIIIESPLVGSDELPLDVDEFNGHKTCFTGNRELGCKSQIVSVVNDKYLSYLINKYKPYIYASEWIAAREDAAAQYTMTVKVISTNGEQIVKTLSHKIEKGYGKEWLKKEIIIKNYPDNVEKIVFTHCTKDINKWAGHYGMKMAGAVVKILLDSVKV
ncbi:hypothetical protein Trydic_g6662 [Trypoxylus dichotomus]